MTPLVFLILKRILFLLVLAYIHALLFEENVEEIANDYYRFQKRRR
jgi:hypothetical protein